MGTEWDPDTAELKALAMLYRNPERAKAVQEGEHVEPDTNEIEPIIQHFFDIFNTVKLFNNWVKPVLVLYPNNSHKEQIYKSFINLCNHLRHDAAIEPQEQKSCIIGYFGDQPHSSPMQTWQKKFNLYYLVA